jgi:diguanylate cyclase (GGDEF)-like protein/PAS domain S-box-containing protein
VRGTPGRLGGWGKVLAWAALLAGILVTLTLWMQSRRALEERAELMLAQRLELIQARVSERVAAYAAVLQGAGGLFAAAPEISRLEWERFARSLEMGKRYPSLQALAYLHRVAPEDAALHERAVRAAGQPGYRIRPPGSRQEMTPVALIQPPSAANLAVLGYDLSADPRLRETLRQARAGGEIVVSGRTELPVRSEDGSGALVLMCIPVREPAAPAGAAAARPMAPTGYVVAVLRVDSLLRRILGTEAADVGIQVFEGDLAEPAALLFQEGVEDADARARVEAAVRVENATWTLRILPRPAFRASIPSAHARAVLVAGLAVSLLLFLSLHSLASGQARAAMLALRMGDALRARERRFAELTRHAPVGVFIADAHGDYVFVNERWCELAGSSDAAARGQGWVGALHPDDREQVESDWSAAVRTGAAFEREFRLRRADGSESYVVSSAVPERDERGEIVAYIGTCMDITARRDAELALTRANEALEARVRERTAELEDANARLSREIDERKHTEEALRHSNARLQALVQELEQRGRARAALNELGSVLGVCNTLEEGLRALARDLGALFPDSAGALYWLHQQPAEGSVVAAFGQGARCAPTVRPHECWALRRGKVHDCAPASGGLLCEHLDGTPAFPYTCAPLSVRGQLLGLLYCETPPGPGAPADPALANEQLAARRQWTASVAEYLALALSNLILRETLESQARHDPLTDLYNRRYMEEALEREVRRAERSRRPMGLIMLDIDHFKRYNDTLGHEAGDRLLVALAGVLRGQVRGGDIVCRYGGEEFLIILPETTPELVVQRAEQLRRLVAAQLQDPSDGRVGPVTLSLGVAVYPLHGGSVPDLVRAADAALYRAKSRGRDRVEVAEASG